MQEKKALSSRGRGGAESGQESQASSCLRKGTPLASRVAQGVSGPSSSCVPLGGTRRVGGLLGVAGRLSGTVSPFRRFPGPLLRRTRGPDPSSSSLAFRVVHGVTVHIWIESPSSMRLEARFAYYDSRAITHSPSPRKTTWLPRHRKACPGPPGARAEGRPAPLCPGRVGRLLHLLPKFTWPPRLGGRGGGLRLRPLTFLC